MKNEIIKIDISDDKTAIIKIIENGLVEAILIVDEVGITITKRTLVVKFKKFQIPKRKNNAKIRQ